MNGYELSRKWFDFCFENPEKIKPNHTALYFFIVEHCNRLGWKQKFGLPTTMAKEAIGIRSYNTYINTLNDLVKFEFIELIEKSKNQYSSNIVALSYFNKAQGKALDKALINHGSKQGESIDSIDKQLTKNKELLQNLLQPSANLRFLLERKKYPLSEITTECELFLELNYPKGGEEEDIRKHFFSYMKKREPQLKGSNIPFFPDPVN